MTILSILMLGFSSTAWTGSVRFASWNFSMGLEQEGELAARLASGEGQGLKNAAAVLQRIRPDVLLVNEFDFQTDVHMTSLLLENYLHVPQRGQQAIHYPHAFRAPVNTGVSSGLDLNDNGKTDDPADAWGFGFFPGQFGMLVLSKYPISMKHARTFQRFLWADMPAAERPMREDGSDYYPDETWNVLRLSSKSHWDLPIDIRGQTVHFLVSHPTPPVFDGPEDRNGRRNHDEIRFWADYLTPENSDYIYDDTGDRGGLAPGLNFVIAGDLNSDPIDGDSMSGSVEQLLNHPAVGGSCTPASEGGPEASRLQGQANVNHQGDPSHDTADFSDRSTGNLRADYVLPSANLSVTACGIFWPAQDKADAEWAAFTDHHLVWLDLDLPGDQPSAEDG